MIRNWNSISRPPGSLVPETVKSRKANRVWPKPVALTAAVEALVAGSRIMIAYWLKALRNWAHTINAFSVSATSAKGYGSRGAPTGRYLAPADSGGCIQVVTGDCARQNLYVTGPLFTRFDLSLVKRVRITEAVNFELRGEFLNAFNNINVLADTNLTNFNNDFFGHVTSAYRDTSNTQDPGGRLVRIVARFNC